MIKNINLVKSIDQDSPPGLNNVPVDALPQITNNFVEHIDCLCLDEIELSRRNNIFITMTQKLCLNGKLTIKIVNPYLLANKINKAELYGPKLSSLIMALQSVWSESECSDIFKQTGLSIENIYYDNIYTIYNLEKQ